MKKIILLFLVSFSLICIAEQMVYITPKGKKYHSTKSCRILARSKRIIEISIEDIGNRQPCKVCY